jgi:imidazolonepropionase-like amidohydrolase
MTSVDPLVLKNRSVLVRNGVIDAVGPSSSIKAPDDAVVIEGNGRILMPGLIDMHVHVWDEAELIAYLANGVTTVRNASGMPFHLELKELIASGEVLGPRLVTTGPILNSPGPNEQVNHQLVETAEEARLAVRMQFEQGYRRLKVYSNLTREAYEGIVEEARLLGMTIMGHTPEGIREPGIPDKNPFNIGFLEVIDDGFVTIEHMESIIWHGLADSLDQGKARKLATSIARAGVAVDPTLLAHRNLVEVARSDGKFLARDGVETLNPFITEFEQEAFQFWSSQPRDARREYDDFYLRAVKIFHEEGVMLVAGTDAGIFTNLPGRSLLRELELYSDAGLEPYEILRTATVNAAIALYMADQIGRVQNGYVADLIIVDENPLESIDHLRQVSGVITNGRWLKLKDMHRIWDEVSQSSYERTRQRVSDGLSAQGSSMN